MNLVFHMNYITLVCVLRKNIGCIFYTSLPALLAYYRKPSPSRSLLSFLFAGKRFNDAMTFSFTMQYRNKTLVHKAGGGGVITVQRRDYNNCTSGGA